MNTCTRYVNSPEGLHKLRGAELGIDNSAGKFASLPRCFGAATIRPDESGEPTIRVWDRAGDLYTLTIEPSQSDRERLLAIYSSATA